LTHDITPQEIAESVDPMRFPPILTPDQAASLLQIGKNTLYRKVSEGCFSAAVRRGKPLRFWRDRLIAAFLSRVGRVRAGAGNTKSAARATNSRG
jgi:excisionase family DNA binding protein